jgi:hypothetical protein
MASSARRTRVRLGGSPQNSQPRPQGDAKGPKRVDRVLRGFKKGLEPGAGGCRLSIPATWEAEIGGITVRGQSGQIIRETSSPKITTAKWTGGVAQIVEHLLSKCETLNSNPSPTKKSRRLPRGGLGVVSNFRLSCVPSSAHHLLRGALSPKP